MKKILALLLALLMLLPALALGESYALTKFNLLQPDDITWFSVSPQGSYLIGYNNDADEALSTLLLYDTAARTLAPLSIQVEEGSDAEAFLRQTLSMPRGLATLQIVWSPDEMHFVLTDPEATGLNAKGFFALHIGSVTDLAITTPMVWGKRMTKAGGAMLMNAGFSADSKALYFMMIGNAYENRYQMLKYDLASGEATPLFSSMEEIDGKKQYYTYRTLIGVNDNLFIQDITSGTGGFSILRKEKTSLFGQSEWKRDSYLTEENAVVMRLEYSPESGFGAVLTRNTKDNAHTLWVFQLDQRGKMLSLQQAEVGDVLNFALSPDGQFALITRLQKILNGDMALLRLDDLSLSPVSIPEAMAENIQYLAFDTIISPLNCGYLWGGDYVIGAMNREITLLRFSPLITPAADFLLGHYTAQYAIMEGEMLSLTAEDNYSTLDVYENGAFAIVFDANGNAEEYQGDWLYLENAGGNGESYLVLTVDGESVPCRIDDDGNSLLFGDDYYFGIHYTRQ